MIDACAMHALCQTYDDHYTVEQKRVENAVRNIVIIIILIIRVVKCNNCNNVFLTCCMLLSII